MNVPLITHILNSLIRRANEDQPGLRTFSRKCRVLTQLHIKLLVNIPPEIGIFTANLQSHSQGVLPDTLLSLQSQ